MKLDVGVFFFNVDHLKNLYWICHNMVSVFWLWGVWDLSSLTRDWTYTLCIGRRSLNDWAVRKSQDAGFFPGLRSLIRRLNSTACKIPYSFPIACGIWKPFTFTCLCVCMSVNLCLCVFTCVAGEGGHKWCPYIHRLLYEGGYFCFFVLNLS